jgi:hypothetical protein
MTKLPKTFVPPQLKDVEKLQTGGVILSRLYFSVANELRGKADENARKQGSEFENHVIPIIILYSTCVESYFNEQLAILEAGVSDIKILESIESIRNCTEEFRKPNKRFTEIYRMFDSKKEGIDTNGSIYIDLLALTALRNSLVHYSPRIIDHVIWPQSLEQVLHRTKLQIINSDWVSNFMRISVADWSYSVSKNAIQEFCRISGRIDPFNSAQYPYPFCWE